MNRQPVYKQNRNGTPQGLPSAESIPSPETARRPRTGKHAPTASNDRRHDDNGRNIVSAFKIEHTEMKPQKSPIRSVSAACARGGEFRGMRTQYARMKSRNATHGADSGIRWMPQPGSRIFTLCIIRLIIFSFCATKVVLSNKIKKIGIDFPKKL